MFINLDEAIAYIENSTRKEKRVDLSSFSRVCAQFDHPELQYDTIHVGGTNGKGSTATYIYSILLENGQNVGLYTSPHVEKYNERIEVNGKQISDDEFIKYANIVAEFNESWKKTNPNLAFFDLLTLMAFLYFKDMGVKIAVIEVGLGGRLDATNVIKPVCSVITNIGKDHMHILGRTYSEIANEKLGIVKENTPLISSISKPELVKQFTQKCNGLNSEFIQVKNIKNIEFSSVGTFFRYKHNNYHTSLVGIHQAKNASMAIEVINVLNRSGYSIDYSTIKKGLINAYIPARFERIGNFIIDGGHNEHAVKAILKTIIGYTNKEIYVVYGAMKDKDTSSCIKLLDSFADRIYFTQIEYHRREDAYNLYLSSNNHNKFFENDLKLLLNKLSYLDNCVILVIGSLYLAGESKKILKEELKLC